MQCTMKTIFPFPVPIFAFACIYAMNVLRRMFLVPVGSASTILYQITSIIKETAQKEKHRI